MLKNVLIVTGEIHIAIVKNQINTRLIQHNPHQHLSIFVPFLTITN